jgi:3-phosphoshikimate 1-carboxyvinyltransferase
VHLGRLRPGDEIGEALLQVFDEMGADVRRDGDTLTMRGGRRLHAVNVDGDVIIDCIPVLVAAACFAEGESVFFNIESLHYKESDRIDDLCAELQRAGCDVVPRRDAIVVRGQPQGIAGGVTVDGHNDHRVLMALSIAALHSKAGLTLTGVEHISKSYPTFFQQLEQCGVSIG